MSEQSANRHLPPDIFVDVLEQAPVDASWRRHLQSCERCAEELASLEASLSWVQADALDEPLGPGETDRPIHAPAGGLRPARRASSWLWLASAAALALAALVISRGAPLTAPTFDTVTDLEEILPPIELDEEFQWLIGLTDGDEGDEEELGFMADSPLVDSMPEAEGLTAEERADLLEQLAEEMRASS